MFYGLKLGSFSTKTLKISIKTSVTVLYIYLRTKCKQK